ncbi:hypothetical protein GIB67_028442 [Kingdonia uniflora]|uniref:Toprim domain-containing protein n=1 Tax=Kingdonia uniflora TaxID=39325 RepID=A0A7J7P1T0_9MAGN|nr:hypothetical protein GIB67_028442 [Kingdonia uniflora]
MCCLEEGEPIKSRVFFYWGPTRIILATDGDAPGQALAEELARRLGKERCWRVKWPKKNEAEDFKDANEVLMCLGANKLKQVIMEADVYPIMGLFKFSDFFSEIDAYYNHEGFELGVSTGWKALNQFYNLGVFPLPMPSLGGPYRVKANSDLRVSIIFKRHVEGKVALQWKLSLEEDEKSKVEEEFMFWGLEVVPGELTIVSGVPNSGKSEWIDALLCNINENVGWKFVLCSMENQVREHARKLLEKHIEKPFFKTGYDFV